MQEGYHGADVEGRLTECLPVFSTQRRLLMPNSDLVVVIVDDNVAESRLMSEVLKENIPDMQVHTFKDCQDALNAFQDYSIYDVPHVVVLDHRMPQMNGTELLSILSAHANFSDIPMIVWTGYLDRQVEKQCIDEGALMVRSKPRNFQEYCNFAKEITYIAQHAQAQIME